MASTRARQADSTRQRGEKRAPLGSKANARAGPGHRKPLHFGHSAEIFDQLRRSACQVPAHGPPLQEPVPVLPDKRQVLPVVASSVDGVEQRTIVIAVERNTKVLEPMLRETNE